MERKIGLEPTPDEARFAEVLGITVLQWREHLAKTIREARRGPRRQALELMAAGWTFELPASHDPEVMSWYWRRPPRRPGKPGRFFASTQQAWNAMRRGD